VVVVDGGVVAVAFGIVSWKEWDGRIEWMDSRIIYSSRISWDWFFINHML